MPTYEYQCASCGKRFEAEQSMSDEPLAACPSCSGPVRRIVSGGLGVVSRSPAGGSTGAGGACSFERTGTTCCGATEPCGKTSCR